METQKFCHHRLNHLFLHRGSYSQFLIWWILRKLVFFGIFWGVSNEKLFVTPWKELEKITWTCCTLYQKIVPKDVSSFSRKSEKLFKSGPYLRCCNGKAHICDQVIFAISVLQIIWNLFYKKNYVFIICFLSAIKVFPKTTLKKKLATPFWWPPLEPPIYNIFAARNISCKKTSAFRKSKNWSYQPWFVGGRGPL